jgi:hypothetical protein
MKETTKACLNKKEPTTVEMAKVAAHPQVPNEEAKV